MSNRDRVIWDEGMMLAPQHFQQWERWVDGELAQRVRAGTPHGYGFTALDIDRGALAGGQLAITHCAGFLPDGTAFDCPGRDALPAPRAIVEALDDKQQAVTVHLAVPKAVPGSSTYGEGSDATPLLRHRQSVQDAARPETEREISTGRLNLGLRLETEDLQPYRTMPVARLVRSAGGGVEMPANFAPPCLTIAASPLCLSILRQVAGMLAQKWTELSGKRRGGGGMADASGLLLLHTAGESLPMLRHCIENGGVSPEQAYLHLARLAAQMCSFHETMTPTDVPVYRHDDAGKGLRELGDMLQEMLGGSRAEHV